MQQAVLDDPFRRKAVLCPRRAGKSFTAMAAAFITALRVPDSLTAIVTLTSTSAHRIYWKALLSFGKKYGLNLDRKGGLNHTAHAITLENGSQIFLIGAGNLAEIEKLRGPTFDMVVLDECKSFSAGVLSELVDDILRFATMDRSGTILLVGTPGHIMAGPFYEATFSGFTRAGEDGVSRPISRDYRNPDVYWETPDDVPEWSFHSWTTKDNTSCVNADGLTMWQKALSEKKAKRWADDNPTWLREGLGKWAASEDAAVYAFPKLLVTDGEANCRAVWTRGEGPNFDKHGLAIADGPWQYILGIDYGYEDDTAFVVMAYSETVDTLYEVYDFKSPHLTIADVASKVADIQERFDNRIEAIVCDVGAMKQMVESMNEIYGFNLVAADKHQKQDFIELLNSDLYDGRLKILRDSQLAHEWIHLQFDLKNGSKADLARRGRLVEDSQCANHLSDAALYTWRFSLHHFQREKITGPAPGSSEYIRAQLQAQRDEVTKRRERERSGFLFYDLTEFESEHREREYETLRDSVLHDGRHRERS